jgi:hypothetical protein
VHQEHLGQTVPETIHQQPGAFFGRRQGVLSEQLLSCVSFELNLHGPGAIRKA